MKLIISIFAFCFALSAFPASWYVDNTATGADNGTSWVDAWTSYNQTHIDSMGDGDTLYISGGTTNQTYSVAGGIDISHRNVRIGQDAGHNGIVIYDGGGTQGALLGQNLKSVVFSGDAGDGLWHFKEQNFTTGLSAYGDGAFNVTLEYCDFGPVRFLNSTNVVLTHCKYSGSDSDDAVIIWGAHGEPTVFPYTNNSINFCTITGARQDDSSGYGTDLIQQSQGTSGIHDNLFTVRFIPTYPGSQHQDHIQINAVFSDCAYYNNTLQNVGNYMLYFSPNNSTPLTSRHIYIWNNVFQVNAPTNNNEGLTLGLVIAQEGTGTYRWEDSLIAHNTFVDLYGRGAMTMGLSGGQSNVILANNLSYDCGRSGGSPSPAFDFSTQLTNGIIPLNNFIDAGSRGDSTSYGLNIGNSGSNLVQFARYVIANSTNILRLSASDTVARAKGTNLVSQFPFLAYDKNGVLRSSTPDIGAYQTNVVVTVINSGWGIRPP